MPLKQHLTIAILFIAVCAYSISARAQNVYKCGNTYSATPCPDGRLLDLRDRRTPEQRKQTQTAAREDAKQANTLEKERLAQERAALKSASRPTPIPKATAPSQPHAVITQITPKRLKKPGKKPEAFIAEIPGTEKNSTVKKKGKK